MAFPNNVVCTDNKLAAFAKAVVNLENNKVLIDETKSASLSVSSPVRWMKNARTNTHLAQESGVEDILLQRVYYSFKDAGNEERSNSSVCTTNLFETRKVNGTEKPWTLASVNNWSGKKGRDPELYVGALDRQCQTASYKIVNSSCTDDDGDDDVNDDDGDDDVNDDDGDDDVNDDDGDDDVNCGDGDDDVNDDDGDDDVNDGDGDDDVNDDDDGGDDDDDGDDDAMEDGVLPSQRPSKQSSKRSLCSIRHRSNGNGKINDNFCNRNSEIMPPVESHLCKGNSSVDSILASRADVLRGLSSVTSAREGNSTPAANSSAANRTLVPGVGCPESGTFCLKMLQKDSSKFGVSGNLRTKKNGRTGLDNKLSITIDSQPTSIASVSHSSPEIEEIVEEKELVSVVGKSPQIESPAIKGNHQHQKRCGPWLAEKGLHSVEYSLYSEHQPNTGHHNTFNKSHLTALTSSLPRSMKRQYGQWQYINAHALLDNLECKSEVREGALSLSLCHFNSQTRGSRVYMPSEDSPFPKTRTNPSPSPPRDPQIAHNEMYSKDVVTKRVSEPPGNGYLTTSRDRQTQRQANKLNESPSLMSFDKDLIKSTLDNNASTFTLDDSHARKENPCKIVKLKDETQINKETVHRNDKSPQSENGSSPHGFLYPDSKDDENAEHQVAYGGENEAVSEISSLESKTLSNKVNSSPRLNTDILRSRNKYSLRFLSRGGPRPYKCQFDGCTKTYRKSSHLVCHQRIHTGEKPFLCLWRGCNRGFRRSDELKRHYRMHTGERPYKCWFCVRTFSRSDHRILHLRKYHPEENPKQGAS